MLSPSDKVKDYEVIAPLGSGGMAMLYLARRRGVGGFSRLVTLKLVHKHLIEDDHIIKLFLDEARISAHVAHPNVVHVEEVGQVGDSYFIAMEYVHGVSLAELLARLTERRLRLRPKLCVWLAAQIAEALHAAHEAKGENGVPLNIVHHDVSPQNVLIGHTGHVKLIDFGIANCQAEPANRTGRRVALGKVRYMSPEQLRLERADRRTDVYALGVMLWEMLAGRGLFRCQRLDDERDWATRENPPPPSKYSSHAMPALDRVVLKAIACKASERYDNAFQFRSALLRADPSAVKLDAPMVAALMRSMLGEELDRRRAGWPSEVAGELEVAPDVTTSRKWSLDDLTADNTSLAPPGSEELEPALLGGADAQAPDIGRGSVAPPAESVVRAAPSASTAPPYPLEEYEDKDPTLAATPTALRRSKPRLGTISHGMATLAAVPANLRLAAATCFAIAGARIGSAVSAPRLLAELPSPLAAPVLATAAAGQPVIETLKLPPSAAEAAVPARSMRAAAIASVGVGFGSVCLAFGVFLGSFVSPTPRPKPARAPAPAAASHSPAEGALSVRVDPKLLAASQADARQLDASVNELGERDSHADSSPTHTAAVSRRESRLYSSRRGSWRTAKASKAGWSSAKSASKKRLGHTQD